MAQPGRPARSVDLPLAWLAIFLMECLIALHTLWPNYPSLVVVLFWVGTAPFAGVARRWSVASVVGLVLGEAIGYFIAVPWALTWVCLPRNHHAVAITMFLRLFCVVLALSAWASARRAAPVSAGPRWRGWAADAAGLAFGLLLILPFALISSHVVLGHRPYYERVAESRARLQLGPDYADYRYFARRIDPVFRVGASVTVRASLIAYSTALNDVQDVAVTWKDPWTDAR